MTREISIRTAVAEDVPRIASLISDLGYPVTEAAAADRLAQFDGSRDGMLVAEAGDVVGCLSWAVTRVVHRPKPVGRIMMLVVDPAARGTGAGRALVEAAEDRLKALGCGLIEVTSNLVRLEAHQFYLHLGYEKTSFRFGKTED